MNEMWLDQSTNIYAARCTCMYLLRTVRGIYASRIATRGTYKNYVQAPIVHILPIYVHQHLNRWLETTST